MGNSYNMFLHEMHFIGPCAKSILIMVVIVLYSHDFPQDNVLIIIP